MLTFARQHKPERTYTSINEIIESTLKLRTYALETSNIEVNTQLDTDLPATVADAGQLQQVFLNLIVNAEAEMKLAHGRGKLTVKTEKIDDTIRISFRDDGPGIAKKNLDKIFDPFFTTREVGQGTGLGLSMCHGIIAEHEGRIYARSRLGKGATFIVELPILAEEKQLEMAEPAAEVAKMEVARILVIDDEPTVLQYLSELLTGEGHRVETVNNARDALEKIKGKRYNLILLDIKLPGISGIELYEKLQKVAKSLAGRVVFITGDVMGADTKVFLSRTKAPYITKPFDAEELKWDINRILAEAA
jgi:CheY-like chemotaxis protein